MTAASAPPGLPLTDGEIEELDALLAGLPTPLEPLEATSLDGYLCGVLLQPVAVPAARWLPIVYDVDARPAPATPAVARIAALAARRHAELDRAIAQRQWFDPWVYEFDEDLPPSQAVLPWVAGLAAALDAFPALTAMNSPALLEPLAVLYASFDPDDLEDADELLAVIETLEPPADMTQATEDLVRSVLLIADVSRPLATRPATARPPAPRRPRNARRPR
jgi:uncharacterized protein